MSPERIGSRRLRTRPRDQSESETMTWVRLGYWAYLALGSFVMLVVCLIASQWGLAVLFGVVLLLAGGRLLQLRRNPDDA